jgi:glycosyltransferase involved in cell wall biosynthesis
MPPRVTVLMPVHNAADYVSYAIDSILKQRFTDFELLVVDDGSTDQTPGILEECTDRRLRVIRQPRNLGINASLNAGVEVAAGELVARQDADDWSHPDRLAQQVSFLDRHPGVAVVGTQARLIDSEGRGRGHLRRGLAHVSVLWSLLFDNPLIHTSVMYRRSVVQALGGYDLAFPLAADFDLWSRIALESRVQNLPDQLVEFRIHAASSTQAPAGQVQTAEENPRIIRRNLDAILGPNALAPRALALVPRYRLGLDRAEVAPFVVVLHAMLVRFLARTPAARHCPDFWRTVGRQYRTVLSGVRRPARVAAAA